MNKFIMMVGLPGSGKTTKAIELAKQEDAVLVIADDVYKEICANNKTYTSFMEVSKLVRQRIFEALDADKSVIFEAPNVFKDGRIQLLSQLKDYNCEKIAIVMRTPYNLCLKRNANREVQISEKTIRTLSLKYQEPLLSEGFTNIEYIYPND